MIKRKLTRLLLIVFVIVIANSGLGSPSTVLAKNSQQKMAQSYYEILNNIINKYGISTKDSEEGLIYTNLIDFDKDGRSELYVLYSKDTELAGQQRFYQEVWGISKDSKLKKIYADDQGHDGLISDRSISIATTKNASYLIFTERYNTGGSWPYVNIASEHTVINTIKNEKLVESAVLAYIEAGKTNEEMTEETTENTFSIKRNGKTKNITEKEYNQLKNQFGVNNQKEIVEGNAGSPEIVIDTTQNEKIIKAFMTKLKKLMK
jgi:hypothetical protein